MTTEHSHAFTSAEAERIRNALHELRAADRDRQKSIRASLRRTYGFYITNFDCSRKGFTVADFDYLVASGEISVR